MISVGLATYGNEECQDQEFAGLDPSCGVTYSIVHKEQSSVLRLIGRPSVQQLELQ